MNPVYLIFDSAKLKLERAEEHLKSFEREALKFLEAQPYRADTEIRADGREFIEKIKLLQQPPKRFSVIVGDCVHNLRSALDHMAFDLAGRPVNEDVARNIQFPIFPNPPQDFAKATTRNLAGMATGAKTIIEDLQPYNRPDFIAPNEPYPLRIIHELSNIDKHRELHIAGLALVNYKIGVHGGKLVDEVIRLGPFEDGAEIARFVIDSSKVEVETQRTLTVSIKMRHPRGAMRVDSALWAILKFIRTEVMSRLSHPTFFQ